MALFSKSRPRKLKTTQSVVRAWLMRGAGRRLMHAERQILQKQLNKSFGSYALFYNGLDDQPYATLTRHQVRIGSAELAPEISCAENFWPIQPDSLDVVVLQHSLEFAASPHEVLREAVQAVRPGGHLVILGTNPYGCLAVGRWVGCGPWRHARCVSQRRVSEWLSLLGFHVEERRYFSYRPLFLLKEKTELDSKRSYVDKKQWPVGNCYMLVARKMMQGSFLQTHRKLAFKTLMPLPVTSAGSANRQGKIRND